MTACGAPGAPGILKCLRAAPGREVFVYGVDANPGAVGFALVDAGEVCPPGGAPGYAEAILQIVRRERIRVVLPLSSMELGALAGAADRFRQAGAVVLVSDPAGLKAANNKADVMAAAARVGVPVPESRRVADLAEFQAAVASLGYPDRAVCFKPEFGKGGRGFRILSASHDRFTDLFEQKPGSAYMTLAEAVEVLGSRPRFPPLLVMEHLPGAEHSVDVLCHKGRSLAIVPRVRTAIKLGICFDGTVEKHDALAGFSERLVRELSLSYCINLQFKADAAGVPRILEVNPRVSGTIVLSAAAGVNLPYLAVQLGLGEPLGPTEVAWGTRMIRYWDEVFYDADQRPFALADHLGNLPAR